MSLRFPSLLGLAVAAVLLPQCHSAADDRTHGVTMREVDDLDTDDVGAVRERYGKLENATTSTMASLRKALEHDPRVRVRANAATALDAMPLIDVFGKSVFDQNRRDIRRYLIRALDDTAPAVLARAANALAQKDRNDADAREALQKHLPQLRAAVASPDERAADDALWTLRTMQVPLPLDVLLRSTSARFREMGVEQADIEPNPAVVPLIVELALKDPVPAIRRRTLPVLVQQVPADERDKLLVQLLDDADEQVAVEAARAVGRGGVSTVAPHLRQIVAKTGGDARLPAAIGALAKLNDTAAVPAIAAHMNDEPVARAAASLALDALVGPRRVYTEWQTWAKQQGYLR